MRCAVQRAGAAFRYHECRPTARPTKIKTATGIAINPDCAKRLAQKYSSSPSKSISKSPFNMVFSLPSRESSRPVNFQEYIFESRSDQYENPPRGSDSPISNGSLRSPDRRRPANGELRARCRITLSQRADRAQHSSGAFGSSVVENDGPLRAIPAHQVFRTCPYRSSRRTR